MRDSLRGRVGCRVLEEKRRILSVRMSFMFPNLIFIRISMLFIIICGTIIILISLDYKDGKVLP